MSSLVHNKPNSFVISLLLVAVASVSGCSAIRSDYTSWEGHSSEDLLAAWGEPTSIENVGVDYVSYTWADAGGTCERSFAALDGKIVGYSEYNCQDR